MSLFTPNDPDNNWTAWEYARAIVHYLREIMQSLQGEEAEPERTTRFLTGQADADGAATSLRVAFRVPAGAVWKLQGYAADAAAVDWQAVRVYRNIEAPSGLIDVIPPSVQGGGGKGAATPLALDENTQVIFVARYAAAPGVGNPLVVNLAVEQTVRGVPAHESEQGGDY